MNAEFRPVRTWLGLFLLLAALGVLVITGLAWGSVSIPVRETAASLLGHPASDPVWESIIWRIRLPRLLAAILGGASLALSGLEMQTLFRNPLAGPYSMGISAGATLGVALVLLAGSGLAGSGMAASGDAAFGAMRGLGREAGVAGSAILGAGAVMMGVLALSRRIRDNTVLLILGLMFGQVAGALVSVLQAFSGAEQIRAFTFWTFGSFSEVTWDQMPILAGAAAMGLALAALCAKPLNALLLGENYARSLGVSLPALRPALLASASILAGATTAYCGPVAFLGLAVPHLCRGLFRTADHRVLIPASVLLGASLALLADQAAGLPGSERALPLNAVTAMIGAPVVIAVLLRRRPGAAQP